MSFDEWGSSEDVAYEEEVEYAYAEERERELEELDQARSRASMDEFDRRLDEYQEREREMAEKREALGDIQARRPDADRREITFGDLQLDDYITAETGPDARWTKVVEIKPSYKDPAMVAITFQVPQPIGVGMHDRYVIDRAPTDTVVIDGTVRS